MGRAVFNNKFGFYGIRGKCQCDIVITSPDGSQLVLRGFYMRIDRHGNPNVICKLPDRDYSLVSEKQQQKRKLFTDISKMVAAELADPLKLESWKKEYEQYKKNKTATALWQKGKIITLRGFVFSKLYNNNK